MPVTVPSPSHPCPKLPITHPPCHTAHNIGNGIRHIWRSLVERSRSGREEGQAGRCVRGRAGVRGGRRDGSSSSHFESAGKRDEECKQRAPPLATFSSSPPHFLHQMNEFLIISSLLITFSERDYYYLVGFRHFSSPDTDHFIFTLQGDISFSDFLQHAFSYAFHFLFSRRLQQILLSFTPRPSGR